MASGFIIGILVIKYKKYQIIAAAAIVFFYVLYRLLTDQKCRRTVLVWLAFYVLFFSLGVMDYEGKERVRNDYEQMISDGQKIVVQGELAGKEWKEEQYSYTLKKCYISAGKEILPCDQILLYRETDTISIGQTIVAAGTVKLWESARNEGNFDPQSYYESKNIGFSLKDAEIRSVYGRTGGIRERLFRLRGKIRNVYRACLTEEDAGVLETMTMGDKSLLDPQTRQLYQSAGISHILAISGLHISVLGMGLYQLLRKSGRSYLAAGILSFLVLAGYSVMAGMGTSSVRAVVMFGVMLTGQWIGRSYDLLSALSFAAVVLLWENPYLLWYAGFLLSFAAILGIACTAQTLLEIQKPELTITETFLVSFSIQLATVPLTAYFFYEVPVWSMCINCFVLPVVGVLLFLGLSGGVVGMFVGFLARVLFLPCHWILLFYRKICEISQKLPFSNVITGQPAVWKLVLFYLALAGCLVLMRKKASRKGFVPLALAGLCLVLWNPIRGMELDILDVGQGDAIFLHTESDTNLFFDGGSTDVKKVGTYRILPFLKAKGVSDIDYWIVSHTDADHISGLCEILDNGYRVKNLVVSDRIPQDEAYGELENLARVHDCEMIRLHCGDAIKDNRMKLQCIFPDESYSATEKNALSLVMRYEDAFFSGLFTGDISEAEEQYLLKKNGLGKVNFYKAAHHGSKYSNSEVFLLQLSPEISVISCAARNRYGHPGESAVQHISQTGSDLYYTMTSGRIRIRCHKGKTQTDTYRR